MQQLLAGLSPALAALIAAEAKSGKGKRGKGRLERERGSIG